MHRFNIYKIVQLTCHMYTKLLWKLLKDGSYQVRTLYLNKSQITVFFHGLNDISEMKLDGVHLPQQFYSSEVKNSYNTVFGSNYLILEQ